VPTGKPYKPNEADRLKLTLGLEFGLTLKFIAQNMGLSVNTLKSRYRDVIEAAELAGGNRFTPTEEQRKMVTMAAAVGLPHEDIAEALHVSRNTLAKYFGKDLLGEDPDGLAKRPSRRTSKQLWLQARSPDRHCPAGAGRQ
jgi:hypothetical protein